EETRIHSAVEATGTHVTRDTGGTGLRWSTIIAGTFLSLLFFSILITLGAGVGGQAAVRLIQGNDSGEAVGIGTIIWTSLAFIISLFAGQFVVSRTQIFLSRGVAATQGLIAASLFFALLLSGVGSVVGMVGRLAGQAAGVAGQAASSVAQTPQMKSAAQAALDGLDLRSPPEQVINGVVTRIASGNSEGARDFLAAEAGITPEEAQTRIDRVGSQIQTTAKDAGTGVAKAASAASFGLCLALVLGAISAALGGALGARRSLVREDRAEIRPRTRAA
ncbi:MAG TPA: hypothetical protein VM598_11845, partial [Bdellovibrionota bacterium]|nr:hypothetical protein [Bdellovibrionota bacterium]